MSARRRWLLAGGGTGGHVSMALALAEILAGQGDAVLVVGSDRGLETRLVPAAGFTLETLPARQVMGQGLLARLRAVAALPQAIRLAAASLRRFRPDFVISLGGYAAVPAVLAAALRRVPIALVEPNAVPGRSNRLAARFATLIFVGFEAAAARFAARGLARRVRNVGTPLRPGLAAALRAGPPRREPHPPLRLLVLGGSQGARQLNDVMIEVAPRLGPEQLEVFHQSGEADRERVATAYADAGIEARVVAFENDLAPAYRWADLALARAGALSVAELALAGLPALLVPYPHAADDHQTANARALVESGAARRLDPHTLDAAHVAEALRTLSARPETLRAMQQAAEKQARPEAAERIVAECREHLDAGRNV